ncbi:MAG: Tat pathway signal protein, partial [Gemmatimonadaceae bacterium]
RVALRYGPLVYNIEKVDQDIDGVLDPTAPLTTEWRKDLLGGVTVIKGAFTNGTAFTAIPNYTRFNRQPVVAPVAPLDSAARAAAARDVAEAAARAVAAGQPLPRPPQPSPASIVWIREK